MIIALVSIVWVGLFLGLGLSHIYKPAGKKPKPAWRTALELPSDALSGSWRELLVISTVGLFLELLMIRWISSEIGIFAYFKNFVLIACFLGFGWLVNAITISGILVLIVGANMLERAGLRVPTPAVYAGLFATLLVAYAVPVSDLLAESRTLRIAGAIAVLCGPIFFASIVFIRKFAAVGFTGTALGSNLFGALVGGLLESLSMWIGLRPLLFLAAALYLLAYVTSQRQATIAPMRSAVPVS